MAKKATGKPEKLVEWKRQVNPGAAYSECARTLVHYSSKTVNSNATAAGVRLAATDLYNGPYLAVSTVGPVKVPIDYVRGANPDAALIKQMEAVRSPLQRARFCSVPAEEEEAIKTAIGTLDTAGTYGLEWVDARLRQILFPTTDTPGDEHYVAITPLNAAGFSELVKQRIENEYAAHELAGQPKRYRTTAQLGYGGSNPQNVGRWVRSMQRALVYLPPSNDADKRRALAIYFQGPGISKTLGAELDAYAHWRHQVIRRNQGQVPGDLPHRQAEQDLLGAVAKRALVLGAEIGKQQVIHMASDLTDAEGDINPVERALVDTSLRERGFTRQLAQWVTALISTHHYRPTGQRDVVSVGISSDDAARLASVVEEALR